MLNPLVFIVAMRSTIKMTSEFLTRSQTVCFSRGSAAYSVVLTLLATVPGLEAIYAVVIKLSVRGLEMYFGPLMIGGCLILQVLTKYANNLKN